jgi:hypothetical protein
VLCLPKRTCVTGRRATFLLRAPSLSVFACYQCEMIDVLTCPSREARTDIALALTAATGAPTTTVILVPTRWCLALLRRLLSLYTTYFRQIDCHKQFTGLRSLHDSAGSVLHGGFRVPATVRSSSWLRTDICSSRCPHSYITAAATCASSDPARHPTPTPSIFPQSSADARGSCITKFALACPQTTFITRSGCTGSAPRLAFTPSAVPTLTVHGQTESSLCACL